MPSEFYEGGILIGQQGGYFEHLAHENTAKSRAILVKARQEADALGLDNELFDEFVVGSGLEYVNGSLPFPTLGPARRSFCRNFSSLLACERNWLETGSFRG